MNLLQACEDPQLFGRWFRNRDTWASWFAFIAALFALPMTSEQLAIFQRHTERQCPPVTAFVEAWLICGRRAGKSFALALVAVYLACFKSYEPFLGPGERGTLLVIATDRRQARVIMRYIRGIIAGVPMLNAMIEGQLRADGIDLSNRVTIEVGTASFRTSRGYAFIAVLADELAFWPSDDSAEPDYAILDAIRPGMASIPGSVLLCASSPYAKRGALWDSFRRFFGKDDASILVWKAATREMNPTIQQSVIDRAMERDAASARAEYHAEFRNDVQAFLSRDAIEAVVEPGCRERPPVHGVAYTAHVDPSGGSSDSFTLAIAHHERMTDIAVLDCIRERKPPFSPEAVVDEFCTTLRSYGVSSITGDRYAGEWPREQFRKRGIQYQVADLSASDIYRAFMPLVNSRKVDLLDNLTLVNQLAALERHTSRAGKDLITHSPASHDDVGNASAAALHYASYHPQVEIDIGMPVQVCAGEGYDDYGSTSFGRFG